MAPSNCITISELANALVIRDGTLFATSRDVAERFGKRHDNVLQAIQSVECSEEFALLNFQGGSYLDPNNQARPMVEMTRDGFTFLVMGFTGKEAAAWKEKYIGAFNWMEEQLRSKATQPSSSFDLATMTSAALRELAAKIEENAALKSAVIMMQPKAEFYDHVAGSEALFNRSDAAKMLRTGPKRLWNALRDWKIVQASGMPYQKYFDLGYFRLVPVLVHKGGYSIPHQQTLLTGKGLTWVKALMDSKVMAPMVQVGGLLDEFELECTQLIPAPKGAKG